MEQKTCKLGICNFVLWNRPLSTRGTEVTAVDMYEGVYPNVTFLVICTGDDQFLTESNNIQAWASNQLISAMRTPLRMFSTGLCVIHKMETLGGTFAWWPAHSTPWCNGLTSSLASTDLFESVCLFWQRVVGWVLALCKTGFYTAVNNPRLL